MPMAREAGQPSPVPPNAVPACACLPLRPRSAAQFVLLVSGDTLISIGDGGELVAGDDIVDPREGLVAGAPEDLAEDDVGRRRPIGAHDIGGGAEASILIGLERAFRV